MYYQSTKIARIVSIKPAKAYKITEPNIPEKTTEKLFPQNVACSVPGIGCATIR